VIKKSGAISSTVAAAALLVLAVGGPANALGSKSLQCAFANSFSGSSYSYGAQTQQENNSGCGNVGVRYFYQTYAGSPVYYSGWSYASRAVGISPGNIGLGGNHKVTSPGLFYGSSFST
jgi:hypothetical protein